MNGVAGGMRLDVRRGPNWLFIRVQPDSAFDRCTKNLHDAIWDVIERHFVYRVVLELDTIETLPDDVIAQLVVLQERLAQRGGALRLCGLAPTAEESLHEYEVDKALPNHSSWERAVLVGELARHP